MSDAARDGAHFRAADNATGFQTLSTATAPVRLGNRNFGAIQAINRRTDDGVGNFREADMSLLETLAGSLALAMSNVELTQAAIDDSLLRRDLDQAREAQAAMMPPPDPTGAAAGRVCRRANCPGISLTMCGSVTGWLSARAMLPAKASRHR